MEEKGVLNKRLILKVSAEILSNTELTLSEKLVLSLDYTLSTKRGYNIITNLSIGELLRLHQNVVSSCRRNLIKKGYLIKDDNDKRIYRLTDKLKSVEIPFINGKKDVRTIVIPFEIYNHPHLQTGSKLLFGEYNSMSKTDKGYFSKRDTTSKRMNVSMGSITNWTKELERYDLLDEYKIESGYYTKQKTVRTKEFKREVEKPIDDFDEIIEGNHKKIEEIISKDKDVDFNIEKRGKKNILKDEDKEEKSKILPLGGVKKYSELKNEINKQKYKHNKDEDEDEDENYVEDDFDEDDDEDYEEEDYEEDDF